MSFGIAITINANLGISPVSSLPFVIGVILGVSTGTVLTIVMWVFILLQIIILRSQYKLLNLTQFFASVLLGTFVDVSLFILGGFSLPTYLGQFAMLVVSIPICALGIYLFLRAKLAPLPLEGFILAIIQVKPKFKFHIVKITADCTIVCMGIILSFIFLNELVGIREGTILSAIFIGKSIPYVKRIVDPFLRKISFPE